MMRLDDVVIGPLASTLANRDVAWVYDRGWTTVLEDVS